MSGHPGSEAPKPSGRTCDIRMCEQIAVEPIIRKGGQGWAYLCEAHAAAYWSGLLQSVRDWKANLAAPLSPQ